VAIVTKNVEVADKRLSIETGRVAEQANGAVVLRQGDTVVLSTAVMAKEPREGIDWFPLTCDYEEKLYAAGKIPGAFMRREGRPSEAAILASRLTDRPLRPLFPDGFRLDVQVVSTVLSVDQENDPTILSINGASTALTISDIPFHGPVGAVRMGHLDGHLIVNPPMSRIGESELDLVVAGTEDAILMVEAGAKGVTEQVVLDALEMAHEAIKQLCAGQLELQLEVGRQKLDFVPPPFPPQIVEVVSEYLALRLDQAAFNPDKAARDDSIEHLKKRTVAELGERLIVAQVQDSIDQGRVVEELGPRASRNRLQTTTLLDTIEAQGFDAAFGGARRDEEKARAKERVLSFRDDFGQWDPKHQRPELWELYNGRIRRGEHIRAFPISNWTELDVWQYIAQERLEVPSIYFAHRRQVFARDGMLLAVGPHVTPLPGEDAFEATVRYRTVGDMSCTGAVLSDASTVEEIIEEVAATRITERGATRADDKFSEAAMEDRKREGYF